MKKFIAAFLFASAMAFAGGIYAQSETVTPTPTMSVSPTVSPTDTLEQGVGGSGTTPSGAPNSGLGGAR